MPKMDKLFLKLKEIVGEAHVIYDSDNLKTYTIDGKKPKVVVSPASIDEVSKIISYAHQQRHIVVPRGNGTKIGMGGIPKKIDIILSTHRLNRITDNDCENLTLSAESGITLSEVQKSLAQVGKGYFLPLDPPFTEKATLGGIVVTNSSGPKRLLYGTTRDLIIGTKAVFPNGDMVISGGKTVKNVSGYDMCKLLIGSYGTLGILCEMTFKLLPLAEREATLVIPFKRLEEANQFVQEILQSQLLPSSMEILNETAISKMKFQISTHGEKGYWVAIGLEGVTESIERLISEMGDRGKKNGSLEPIVLDLEAHQSFWRSLRNFSVGLMEEGTDFISLKSNFMISKSGELMGIYEKIAGESGLDCALICHSGNGVLYSYLLDGDKKRSKTEPLIGLIQKFTTEAVRNGGGMIVELAPLAIKKRIDVWGEPRGDYEIMRRLKKEIDPKGTLNPGRFVGGI